MTFSIPTNSSIQTIVYRLISLGLIAYHKKKSRLRLFFYAVVAGTGFIRFAHPKGLSQQMLRHYLRYRSGRTTTWLNPLSHNQ